MIRGKAVSYIAFYAVFQLVLLQFLPRFDRYGRELDYHESVSLFSNETFNESFVAKNQNHDLAKARIQTMRPPKHEKRNATSSTSSKRLAKKGKEHLPETSVINYTWKTHPLWNGGMSRYCNLINERLQRLSKENHSTQRKVVVNFTMHCIDPYSRYGLGTGNIVMAVYGLQLAAASHGVDFWFDCSDVSVKDSSQFFSQKDMKHRRSPAHDVHPFLTDVLPWLQGYHSAPTSDEQHKVPWTRFDPPVPPREVSCQGFAKHPLHYQIEEIRQDMRTLAVHLLGDPSHKRQHSVSVDGAYHHMKPLVADAVVDDVAIHFRCGDILLIKTNTYGIVSFDAYRRLISPHARTIGIITQSFGRENNRDRDKHTTEVCKFLALGLTHYLQHHFPRASISIRNGPGETPATAYARLVLANQSFSALSTFSSFPSLASSGTAFIPKGRLTYFCPAISERYSNVKMFDGQVLTSNKLRELSDPREILRALMNPKNFTLKA